MKSSNIESFDIDVERSVMVQITFVPKIEMIYIKAAKYAGKEKIKMSDKFIERVELAVNRLLQDGVKNGK